MENLKDLYEDNSAKNCKDWILENVIPSSGIHLLSGEVSSGKTMFAVNLCKAIEDGETFLGLKTKKAKILYISTEMNSADMKQRFKSSEIKNISNITLDCNNEIDSSNLIYKVKDYDFIIFDIIAQYVNKKNIDNNSYLDVYNIFDEIRENENLKNKSWLLLTHLNKKGKTMGTTAFEAAADTRIVLTSPNGNYDDKRKLYIYGKQVKKQEIYFQFNFPKMSKIEGIIDSTSEENNAILAYIISYVIKNKKIDAPASEIIRKLKLERYGCYPSVLTKILNSNNQILKNNGISLEVGTRHSSRYIKLCCLNNNETQQCDSDSALYEDDEEAK